MVTQTARKHIIKAIRQALRVSYHHADFIVEMNWRPIHQHGRPLHGAVAAVEYVDWTGDRPLLNIYVGGELRFALRLTLDDIEIWKTLPMAEAYPEIPGRAEYEARTKTTKLVGTLTLVGHHPSIEGALILVVEADAGDEHQLLLLPLGWHEGDQLLRYASQFRGQRRTFHYCRAQYASACIHGLQTHLSPDALVAEFILEPPAAPLRLAA